MFYNQITLFLYLIQLSISGSQSIDLICKIGVLSFERTNEQFHGFWTITCTSGSGCCSCSSIGTSTWPIHFITTKIINYNYPYLSFNKPTNNSINQQLQTYFFLILFRNYIFFIIMSNYNEGSSGSLVIAEGQ